MSRIGESRDLDFLMRTITAFLVTMVPLVGVLARASGLAAQGAAAGPTPEDSVRALETARGQALLQRDTVALSRMVADEFIEISRLGARRTKADNLRRPLAGGGDAADQHAVAPLRQGLLDPMPSYAPDQRWKCSEGSSRGAC